jgi:hypothetical protein
VRSTAAPYTESRLTRSVANERVGFPVVEHCARTRFDHETIEPKIFVIYLQCVRSGLDPDSNRSANLYPDRESESG